MNPFLFDSLTIWRPFGYVVVFLGMVIEGEAILFIAAFLAHQGFFDLGSLFIVAFAGMILGDLFWYWLGSRFYNSYNCLGRFIHKLADPLKVDDHLKNRTLRTIFISKFTYGLHHLVLIHAGAAKISLRKFFENDLVSTIPWIILIGSLGYLSSASFFLVRGYLRAFEITLIIGLILFLVVDRLVARSLKDKI